MPKPMTIDDNFISDRIIDAQNTHYIISSCDEKTFIERAEEFSRLCRQAFAEHAERNVKMGPCYMTSDKWIELSRGCIGQYVEDSNNIIAFWLAYPNYKKKETYGKILAVDPKHKGKHLGISLAHSRSDYLRKLGMNIFITDTSLKAPHVVKFHKSYGCKAVGVTSWSNTNYYTVILRLALRQNYEISDTWAYLRFMISKYKCKMLLREDGSATLLGKIISPAWSKIKHMIVKR